MLTRAEVEAMLAAQSPYLRSDYERVLRDWLVLEAALSAVVKSQRAVPGDTDSPPPRMYRALERAHVALAKKGK